MDIVQLVLELHSWWLPVYILHLDVEQSGEGTVGEGPQKKKRFMELASCNMVIMEMVG